MNSEVSITKINYSSNFVRENVHEPNVQFSSKRQSETVEADISRNKYKIVKINRGIKLKRVQVLQEDLYSVRSTHLSRLMKRKRPMRDTTTTPATIPITLNIGVQSSFEVIIIETKYQIRKIQIITKNS